MTKPGMKIRKGTIKRLASYIKNKYKKQFIAVMILVIISSGATVAVSLFLQKLIDNYIIPILGMENPIFDGLLKAIGIIIVICLSGIISTYIYNRIMSIISQGVLKDIRDEMFNKMQDLPIKYFDTHTHGNIMSRYTNDVDTLEQTISQVLPQMISSIITVIVTLCAMIYLSKLMTIFVIIFTAITLIITKKISMKSSKHFIKGQESLGKVNGYIEEMLNGQKVIKVFTHEKEAKNAFMDLNNTLNEDTYIANKYANILMPLANNLGNMQYVVIAIIGSLFSLNGVITLTVGTIVSFLQLTRSFSQPINQMMNQLGMIMLSLAGAGRIFEMMDEEPEKDEGYVTLVNAKLKNGKIVETEEQTGMWAWKYPHHNGTLEYIELKGHIEMTDVNFGYEPSKIILHNVSLYAKPGQKIAFVGATGAGKTTITNLINRFYDIEDGKIRYDGININKIKKADLRKSLGMVLQDTNLFTGTIKENIKYGKSNATDEEVIEAAKLANAHEFISMLPKGYDTKITGNGAQLSQGQRQLISIARVAVNNPPVMILDEATSSIDTRTEKIVQEGMDKLMQGRTVFVIAHRLSTVRNSKAILVLDHGTIIERGEHEELLAQKGEYYELYTGAIELE